MNKSFILAAAAIAALLLGALPAAAHDRHQGLPPYWIDDIYQGHDGYNYPRMFYAPGNTPMQDHYRYWYNGRGRPCIRDPHFNRDIHRGGSCHGFFRHRHHRLDNARHVRWCRAHYRSYRAASDTYTAYSGAKLRCNSPYAGR